MEPLFEDVRQHAVQAALEVSDLIILITTQDIPAIKNSNLFLSLADATGIRRDHILFVMNRFDKRVSITPERVGESLRQELAAKDAALAIARAEAAASGAALAAAQQEAGEGEGSHGGKRHALGAGGKLRIIKSWRGSSPAD